MNTLEWRESHRVLGRRGGLASARAKALKKIEAARAERAAYREARALQGRCAICGQLTHMGYCASCDD